MRSALLLLLPLLAAAAGLSLQQARMRHLGVCPNQLNPNLWVDARSTCARECPAGAISPENPAQTDAAKCITCMRCVAVCPQKARSLPAPVLQMLSQKLAPFMEKRQENELYL